MESLLVFLMENLLRLVIPDECYIWLRGRHPKLLELINLLLLLPIGVWLMLVFIVVVTMIDKLGEWDRDWVEIVLGLGAVIAPVVLVIVLRLLLRRFWKPSARMLADNDVMVQQEIMEQERIEAPRRAEHAARVALRKLKRPGWRCGYCGTENNVTRIRCSLCDRLYTENQGNM